MRNKINISISLLFLISVLFGGCASSKQEEKNQFRFEVIDSVLKKNNGNICFEIFHIDSKSFDKYYVIDCNYYINKNNKIIDTVFFFILSEKENDVIIDINDYEKLFEEENYCLKLFSIDTLMTTTINITTYNPTLILDPNLVFYENGKIVAKVYFCKDIKDKYVLKNRN
jgi:hypothetical protein